MIGVLQIVNQFGQVFDRVNVVMWRRRNQTYARSRMTHSSDLRINLPPWQLATFSRFCALRHFDLQFLRFDQVKAGDPEPPGSDLLDRAVLRVAIGEVDVAIWI